MLPAQDASERQKRLHSGLWYKRLERGRFIWSQATRGVVSLTPAQLSLLLEGIDGRRPVRRAAPAAARSPAAAEAHDSAQGDGLPGLRWGVEDLG